MGTATPHLVASIVARLLAATPAGAELTLDDVGEAVGAAPVTYEDIEAILDALAAAGHAVELPAVDLTAHLQRVLTAARDLKREHGGTPSVQDLERATGLSRTLIVAALRFADTLRR